MRARLVMVVIGRNEGVRMKDALRSVLAESPHAVAYVDSGSSDGSVALARGFEPELIVHELDAALPFTAARGRNEGFRLVSERAPAAEYVQFLDGDCVLLPGWIDTAVAYLDAHPDVGLVAGRLREEHRDKNIYHRLADMEWNVPSGEVESTGGICMMRVAAFRAAGGFDGAIPAGEELNLALRIRQHGYRIVRLDAEMARHDIRMERFGEWWRRAKRYGHATAESVYLYGLNDRVRRKQLASILTWGAVVPSAAVGLAAPTMGLSLGLLSGYPALLARVRQHRLRQGDEPKDAALYAAAQVVAKFAATTGVAQFARRWAKRELSYGRDMLR